MERFAQRGSRPIRRGASQHPRLSLPPGTSARGLQGCVESACMLYVARQAETLDNIEIDPTAPEGERIRFTRTREGDGQVTWKSGIPWGSRVSFAHVAHGDLARHEITLPAIAYLLERARQPGGRLNPRLLRAGGGHWLRSSERKRRPTHLPRTWLSPGSGERPGRRGVRGCLESASR